MARASALTVSASSTRDHAASTAWRSLALVLATWLPLAACSAPIAYPRTADLADAGQVRFRLSTNFLGLAPSTARVEVAPGTSDEFSDVSAMVAGSNLSPVAWAFNPVLSVEGGLDLSLGLCEVGGLFGLVRVGGELRCGVLQQDDGAPFSLAASAAYRYPVDTGDLYPMEDRHGFRLGIDTSVRITDWGPLSGLYLDRGTQRRELTDSRLPTSENLFTVEDGSIVVWRDEWRLAVPLGIALYGSRGGAAVAVVTEYTLAADRRPEVEHTFDTSEDVVQEFEQHWAVFLAVSAWVTP